MDECDITIKNIQNAYRELIENIYCIIPSSWQNNKSNVYYTKINSYISNGEADLREITQAFPENTSREMLVDKKEIDYDEQILNIKKKCEFINSQIDELVRIKCSYATKNSQAIYSMGNRAKNSMEYMVASIEDCFKEYYDKKNMIENGYNYSIAVIIPAYNTKKTIRRAIDSIARQTLNGIIKVKTYIVNDCSIYNYQDIVTEYSSALDIEEIELKENVGPGLARQNGILKSKEDFIIFLDGDDFFYNEKALEVLLINAVDNKADCVVSYFREESDNGKYSNSNNMGWLHGKMYKSSFIKEKQVEFLNSRATEDAAFNMLLQVNNPKIIAISDVTYVWACNDDSITRKNNYEFIYTYIESYSENIRKILELTAEKNLNMQVAMRQVLNSLFVIWTDYIRFSEQSKRANVLKWTYKLKQSFDKYKSEYLGEEQIQDIFKYRSNLYNPKWSPKFAMDCFDNFLKNIEIHNSIDKKIDKDKDKLNILISFDEDYTCHAVDMLHSIILNNDVSLEIYLLYENLSITSLNVIREFVEANEIGNLHEYYINGKQYSFPHTIKYIPEVTYYRLFAPFIINEKIDKLLYLDCDIIVNGKIDELYNLNIGDNIIAGCKNMLCKEMSHLNTVFNTNLNLPITNDYINAGVLLIDVEKYRNYVSPDKIIRFINENRNNLKMQDQDVINKLFYGKIMHVDNKFNLQINTVEEDYKTNDVRIIHYSQRAKPWESDYYSPQKAKYYYNYLAKKGDVNGLKTIIGAHMDYQKNKMVAEVISSINGE